jgi:hypothetical protein
VLGSAGWLAITPSRIARQETSIVTDSFDQYRESLVTEEKTNWPNQFDELEAVEKSRIEAALHADPENCSELEYFRVHTGFCRTVTVTAKDIERVSQ